MIEREFPILEYDNERNAFMRPCDHIQPADIAEKCVLCFFTEAIEHMLQKYPNRIVAYLNAEPFRLPVYELEYMSKKIALIQAGVGAPVAAAQIEELTALGCKKYIACGNCGVLQKEIAAGHIIIPVCAVRDEGTSYHYMQPSREIHADEHVVRVIENTLIENKVPYVKAKTWTTDAPYRETPMKIKQRKQEGCVTVEMEASAYMAVSQYNQVEFGQILYAGDSLGGDAWDSRDFASNTQVREFVLRLALDACCGL